MEKLVDRLKRIRQEFYNLTHGEAVQFRLSDLDFMVQFLDDHIEAHTELEKFNAP